MSDIIKLAREAGADMTDRDLLELAAKAAGYSVNLLSDDPSDWYRWDTPHKMVWNPLTDDGDALRLAVKLNMTLRCYMGNTCAQIGVPGESNAYVDESDHADHSAATRRAIVRAAATIGEQTP